MGRYNVSSAECFSDFTVLCIDDDPEVSRLLAVRLESCGVHVIRAFDGMQGLWLATTKKPDLIITDLRMPQVGGNDVVECLKNNAETSHIPVFVLTGDRREGLERQMRKRGADEYFVKPYPFETLRERLADYLPVQTTA